MEELLRQIANDGPDAIANEAGTSASNTNDDNSEANTVDETTSTNENEDNSNSNQSENEEDEANTAEDDENEEDLDEEEENDEDEDDQNNDDEEENQPKKSRNRKSNVKKLLKERNEFKKQVTELNKEVQKLKEGFLQEKGKYYEVEKQKFVEKYPNSENYLKQIEQTQAKFPTMSFENAFKIVAPQEFVKGSTNPTTTGFAPDKTTPTKDYNTMSLKEVRVDIAKKLASGEITLSS